MTGRSSGPAAPPGGTMPSLGMKTLGLAAALLAATLAPALAKPQKCEDLSAKKCTLKLSTGITMAYVETGPAKGKTVILIHGLTDSIRSWSTAMRALHDLDPTLHILAVDLRGHGGDTK